MVFGKSDEERRASAAERKERLNALVDEITAHFTRYQVQYVFDRSPFNSQEIIDAMNNSGYQLTVLGNSGNLAYLRFIFTKNLP